MSSSNRPLTHPSRQRAAAPLRTSDMETTPVEVQQAEGFLLDKGGKYFLERRDDTASFTTPLNLDLEQDAQKTIAIYKEMFIGKGAAPGTHPSH